MLLIKHFCYLYEGPSRCRARYNVSGAGQRAFSFKVFAMWFPWLALLVSCALVGGEQTEEPVATTTRAPPRTLDRQAGELAWRTWLQSPEDGNQNAPPRRITTKSLFITPLVCPKGHRLDGTACVQVVTVNKADHERILLEQLNALFTTAPNNGDVLYDYGDEDPGPLQLSIPIGLDPQSSPQDPSAQAQDIQPNFVKVDKKGDNTDSSIEAELELLKLQQAKLNNTISQDGSNILSHNVLHNLLSYSDKPKRDSPMVNSTEIETQLNNTDEGQKELVFGHVNIDPVIYDTETQNNQDLIMESETDKANAGELDKEKADNNKKSPTNSDLSNSTVLVLKKESEDTKLSPENDYSDIGEAIKLISRYAEVSTDDNFAKDDKKLSSPEEDSILGTRTKLQYRRNKPKVSDNLRDPDTHVSDIIIKEDPTIEKMYPKNIVYYRYPWPSENADSPPPNYPFRHLQDYWPGRSQIGGVYNTMHENPRRHHHSYPHYFRPRGSTYADYPETHLGLQETYPGLRRYPHKIGERNPSPIRSHANNQDLYSLLGLRHWFSSEGASKR
ncbi:uncharacterized protein LOC113395026 isoform X1 [Vanessa tameamea]|uniref:Uncharacterized protein LOC113395026 isoform X1 n=2 Tax=Vanessa tameamea TaxID=334116 RepID=A0A8B8HUJ9_VANTA|nr:uncharacterized protein LOC113395026 isoform X1 [Vanessa tameamea]